MVKNSFFLPLTFLFFLRNSGVGSAVMVFGSSSQAILELQNRSLFFFFDPNVKEKEQAPEADSNLKSKMANKSSGRPSRYSFCMIEI